MGSGRGPAPEMCRNAEEFALRMLEETDGSVQPSGLAQQYGCTSGHMQDVLRGLMEDGEIQRVDEGKYRGRPKGEPADLLGERRGGGSQEGGRSTASTTTQGGEGGDGESTDSTASTTTQGGEGGDGESTDSATGDDSNTDGGESEDSAGDSLPMRPSREGFGGETDVDGGSNENSNTNGEDDLGDEIEEGLGEIGEEVSQPTGLTPNQALGLALVILVGYGGWKYVTQTGIFAPSGGRNSGGKQSSTDDTVPLVE